MICHDTPVLTSYTADALALSFDLSFRQPVSKTYAARAWPRGGQASAPAALEAMFSRPFLEEQFPEYYGRQAKPRLPSSGGLQQLIDLFNQLGADGWEYYGRELIGGADLLIFRRCSADEPVQ